MRLSKFSLPVIIAGFALTFLLAGSLSAKERGWYIHGGLAYWNEVHRWENESYFVTYLPGFSTTGWKRDGSASQLSVGGGYNFNKNWAIEFFRMGLPDLVIPGTHWLIPPIEPDDEPVSASWTGSETDGAFLGLSVIYDLYLSERVSLFLKVGGGWSGVGKKKLNSTLTGSDLVLLEEQVPYSVGGTNPVGSDETSVYAVGMRMPLLHYDRVSITVAYQIVMKDARIWNTEELVENTFPPNRTYQYHTRKMSSFQIDIQWRL